LIDSDRHAYHDAEELYARALAIEEQSVGPNHPEVAAMLNNLAQIYGFEGRYDDAEKLYARAIDIWERTLGRAHPDVAGCLLNYAAILRKDHRKKEAGEMEARARESQALHDRDDSTSALVDWRELQRR
jgi:tetratricopeptide (TPR) repeat protein